MTLDQMLLFGLLLLVLGGLLWGRWRYDLVAFSALLVAVLLGLVPVHDAFSGFGHEATIIVALVLVVSAGLSRSGAVDLIARIAVDRTRDLGAHIALFGAIGGALSAFMNNVATLALLMPVDIQAARRAERSPARTLMPLSFATILGGMVTLIGTPPNIIIASYRAEALDAPFAMFDFAPVGLVIAAIGIAFIALGGWRLIPVPASSNAMSDLDTAENYVAELLVPADNKLIGSRLADLDELAEDNDCFVLGLARGTHKLPGRARRATISEEDVIMVQGSVEALNGFSGATGLKFQGKTGQVAELDADYSVSEAVISRDSRLVGRTANQVQMLRGYGISLIGVSRMGKTLKDRIRRTKLQAGDILLLLGSNSDLSGAMARMGLLPLAGESAVTRHEKAYLAVGIFVAAIVLAALSLVPLPIALGLVAVAFVLFDILPIREIYDSIEWPVVVLLGSMIPIGAAMETTGGTELIAGAIADLTRSLPAWMALAIVLITTMTLSDVLNNTATAIVAAPIAVQLAHVLGVNPDAFLMAVAVGASCAFLTPIGHKNNMLILGPGGYRFGDYWRLGLPLEILIIVVGVPMIMLVWPL